MIEGWYLSRAGEQDGPVTDQEVAAMVARGDVDVHVVYGWKEGMAGWKTLLECGFPAPQGIPAPAPAKTSAVVLRVAPAPRLITPVVANPYLPPRGVLLPRSLRSHFRTNVGYGGIGRLSYYFYVVVLPILVIVTFFLFMGSSQATVTLPLSDGLEMILLLCLVLTVGLYLWVAAMRLKNLGMSGWNLFWALVPLANLWLAWRLAACPEGYHKHHNLDTSGVWLTAIYGIVTLLECYNLWSG